MIALARRRRARTYLPIRLGRGYRLVAVDRLKRIHDLEAELLQAYRARAVAEQRLARYVAAATAPAAAADTELLRTGWAAPALPTQRIHAHCLPQQE